MQIFKAIFWITFFVLFLMLLSIKVKRSDETTQDRSPIHERVRYCDDSKKYNFVPGTNKKIKIDYLSHKEAFAPN